MAEKFVILLGAGASVADVATRSKISRPPLDRGFFRTAQAADGNDRNVRIVRRYFLNNYGLDISEPSHDSLEGVMSRLYPDLFNELLKAEALRAFRSLLRLFTRRLASTTNDMAATQKRLLYRMLTRLLRRGVEPADITIITFNQDLQAEKVLEHLGEAQRWSAIADELFCFPHLYAIPAATWEVVSGPTGASPGVELFAHSRTAPDQCLQVLKLHGSLNWYSTHNSTQPSRQAMFNPSRRLSVTRRKTILPDMTLSRRGARRVYTLPVVVPPVNHKSAVLHDALSSVWTLAEQRLAAADHVIIFGYSCPALDFESANLLTRAQRQRPVEGTVAVIDPDGSVVMRYISLLAPSRLAYFGTAHDYLIE